jgi:GABA permease
MRRHLIVANQTLAADELTQAVRDRLEAGPCEFWVVVPATPLTDLAPGFVPTMGGWPVSVPAPAEESRKVARARLDAALQRLREAGANVDGEVGDPDPMRAIEHTFSEREFDEVIVSTLPARVSRWLHQDLPSRVERRFHVPVAHVAAGQPAGTEHRP